MGRPRKKVKASPARFEELPAGARWGESWGLEVPIYFAPRGFEEVPTLKRSNAHDLVDAEVKATREAVGLLDISGFSRFKVTGPNAEAWLDGDYAVMRFAPRALSLKPGEGPPHIRLDRAADFLVGDRL